MPAPVADDSTRLADRAAHADAAATRGSARAAARGFTLLEIVLVMAIIALASVLAAAAMTGGFKGMQLKASAKEIASNLRYTRTQAIETGTPQRFLIDPGKHAWRAPKNHHGTIPAKLGIEFTGAREAQANGAPSGEGAIEFFPDGAATGGRIRLTAGKAAWDIDVAWLTGQVRISQPKAGQ
jgi:general secretion pathway protein H